MNNSLTTKDLFKYTGDISQIFYAKQYYMAGGRAEGLKAVDVNNGSGLQFTILADRCMDIGHLSFNTVNFSHISKTGYVRPEYYDEKGIGGLASFTAGFLTTCGLDNVGSPCEFDGMLHGVHGSIGNVPAEEFCVKTLLDEDIPQITVDGKMRSSSFLGKNLLLSRAIGIRYGENKIHITDTIENRQFNKQPLMLLYHFNFGYPLLNENTKFYTSFQLERPRDPISDDEIKKRFEFSEPKIDYIEQCFYYKRPEEKNSNKSFAAIWNEDLETGAAIYWDESVLPNLTHWKNPKAGDYVMGIEPCNCMVEGIKMQHDKYGLEYLEPQEKKTVHLEIEILDRTNMKIIKDKFTEV